MSVMLVLYFDVQDMTVVECADRLAQAFGVAPASIEIRTTPPIVEVPAPEPVRHNFGMRSHQEVLNLFSRVFGPRYWEVIQRARLDYLALERSARYTGPDIEALPALSDGEKAALIRAL